MLSYGPLPDALPTFDIRPSSPSSRKQLLQVRSFVVILSSLFNGNPVVIVSLRCYALYNRNPRVLIFVALLGLTVLASFVVRAALSFGLFD